MVRKFLTKITFILEEIERGVLHYKSEQSKRFESIVKVIVKFKISWFWKLLYLESPKTMTFVKDMHIPNRDNAYVNFSSTIYPGGKIGKSYENMKISKCCKSSYTSAFVFK